MTFKRAHTQDGRLRNLVCMIAYTKYTYDGRVRLEAESLVRWGYKVSFVVPKEGPKARTYELNGVEVKEVNVVEYGGKSKIRYCVCYIMFLLRAFIACTELSISKRVDTVHVHNMPNLLVLSAIVPRLLGRRLVLDVHDTVIETYEAKFGHSSWLVLSLLRCEEWICCRIAHTVICVNHVQREVLIERHIPRAKIITVITMPRFMVTSTAEGGRSTAPGFRMVNHGTMSRRLGNDLIIRAAARLADEIPGFELHMIGAGDDLPEMISLSKSLGISERVQFHAPVPWNDLAQKLEMMDVGIVANRVSAATELMLPSKLIDYVVLGIPAIVPRLKAIQHYFSEDMVSYFEPGSVDSIVEATVKLYKDTAHRKSQALAARQFLTRHGWDTTQNELRQLYPSLCASALSEARPCVPVC